MKRKPTAALRAGCCLLTLICMLLGSLTTASLVYADTGSIDPPSESDPPITADNGSGSPESSSEPSILDLLLLAITTFS